MTRGSRQSSVEAGGHVSKFRIETRSSSREAACRSMKIKLLHEASE